VYEQTTQNESTFVLFAFNQIALVCVRECLKQGGLIVILKGQLVHGPLLLVPQTPAATSLTRNGSVGLSPLRPISPSKTTSSVLKPQNGLYKLSRRGDWTYCSNVPCIDMVFPCNVRLFYPNLTYECDRLGILSTSLDRVVL